MAHPRQRTVTVHRLGRVEYEDGLQLMKAFFLARKGRAVGDALLLLEHPPVLTLGRGAKGSNVLAPREKLAELGVTLHETDRGGDVTYHGPGQVVGYPIIDLTPDMQDVRKYVSFIEETMIRTCADFGVQAHRIQGWNGTWVGEKGVDARKIGAVGVHISRWITTHGFAFNVNTDLSHFKLIVPCGIADAGVTSLEKELGAPQPVARVEDALEKHFGDVFHAKLERGRPFRRTVSVAVLARATDGWKALLLKRHPHRGNFWQQVTGTIEPNESAEHCARRELQEEAGFDGPVTSLEYDHSFMFGEPRPDKPPRIFAENAFYAVIPADHVPTLDRSEHTEFGWFPVEEAIRRVPFAGLKEGLRRAYRRVQQLEGGVAANG